MPACPHPDCGAELEGLGTFCHTCSRYTSDAHSQPAQEGAPAVPRAPNAKPQPGVGRQVLVLPLISQNRMWGVRVFIDKAKMIAAALAGDWRGMMKAAHGAMHVTHEGREYKAEAAKWLEAQGAYPMTGELRALATLYLPRRIGDTDNYTKALSDALQGPVVENDRQFSEWHVVRRYDKEKPRVVVVLEPDDGSVQLDPGADFQYEVGF